MEQGTIETVKVPMKPAWKSRYNCHQLVMAGGALTVDVIWNQIPQKGSPSGFTVSVNNRSLKNVIPQLEAAKQAGLALAAKILAEATAQLKELS